MDKNYEITFGILTVSDSCYFKNAEDKSGILLQKFVTDRNTEIGKELNGVVTLRKCINDDRSAIANILLDWSEQEVNVILTTGGTGFTSQDVTPEATEDIIEKKVPGICIAMMMASLEITPMAILSRSISGIRKKTLIINLPGSPKGAIECLNAVIKSIPHAVQLILGINTKKHPVSEQNLHSHDCSHSLANSSVADRLRESPFPMVSINEATNIIIESTTRAYPPKVEYVELDKAFQRVLSKTLTSPTNLPPFRASIKDGYAVIHSDTVKTRYVCAGIAAGQKPGNVTLKSGYCARVNTGCPIPENATAVVQVEDTRLLKKDEQTGEEIEVEILAAPAFGQDIRPVGCDIEKGTQVLEGGTKLGSVEIGILSACGFNLIPVFEKPKVGIISTGNELQEPGTEAKEGCIYDSNRITLKLLLKEHGYDAVDFGIVQDDKLAMIKRLQTILPLVHVLITTGSVSMGDKDMLKPILQYFFHATIHFGRVNVKPGKPTTFATCSVNNETKYILCLPGNPVSATVTTYLFALPLLRKLSGSHEKPIIVNAKLTFPYKLDPRPDYVRTCLVWKDNEIPEAHSTGNQISSKLTSFTNANALLMMPEKTETKTEMKIGDIVPAMLLRCHM